MDLGSWVWSFVEALLILDTGTCFRVEGFPVSLHFPTADVCSRHTIFPGVTVQTCSAEHLMLSVANLAAHAVVEEHAHPHEQVGVVLEGRAIFYIGGEQK